MLEEVESFDLAVGRHPQRSRQINEEEQQQGHRRDHHHARQAADELGLQLVDAAAVEQALHRGRRVDAVGCGDAERPGGEQAQTERAPDPGEAVDGHRPDRVVDPQVLQQVDAQWHHDSGHGADEDRAGGVDPVAGTGDRHQPPQQAVAGHAEVPLLGPGIDPEDGHHPAGAGGQRGVGGHPADALEVHGRQRGAGVEPVPPEPQDDGADGPDDEVVGRHWPAAVPLEPPPEPGSQRDGAEQGDEPADGVDHRGAGEVPEDGAVGEVVEEMGGHVAEPAARPPHPVTEDRVDEARHGHGVVDVALEPGAADHGPRGHGRAGVGEGELE